MRIYTIGTTEALEEEERQNGPKTIFEEVVTENTDKKHQITDFGSTVNLSKINKTLQVYI